MNKLCNKCDTTKPLVDFANKANGKNGKGAWCKQCHYVQKRTPTQGVANTGRDKENYNRWAREYRKGVKNKAYEQRFRDKYRGSFSGTVAKLLSGARLRSKRSGISFNLDRDWLVPLLEPMICAATGSPLTLKIDKNVMHTPFRPSIDRIDNTMGYDKDNCRVTCVIFNKAKSDGTDSDVLTMARYLMEKCNDTSSNVRDTKTRAV